MIRGVLIFCALIAVVWFPWPYAVVMTLLAAVASPLAPLAVGLFAEGVYFTPHVYAFPIWLMVGALGTSAAFFVHRFVETSIMGK